MLVTHHRIKHQLVLFTLIDAQLFHENRFTIRHMINVKTSILFYNDTKDPQFGKKTAFCSG